MNLELSNAAIVSTHVVPDAWIRSGYVIEITLRVRADVSPADYAKLIAFLHQPFADIHVTLERSTS